MGPIVDKNKENDKNAPKKLCQMEHHIGKRLARSLANTFKLNVSRILIFRNFSFVGFVL